MNLGALSFTRFQKSRLPVPRTDLPPLIPSPRTPGPDSGGADGAGEFGRRKQELLVEIQRLQEELSEAKPWRGGSWRPMRAGEELGQGALGSWGRRGPRMPQALAFTLCSLPLQQKPYGTGRWLGQEEVQYGPQKGAWGHRAGIGQADIQIGFWHLRVPSVVVKVCS